MSVKPKHGVGQAVRVAADEECRDPVVLEVDGERGEVVESAPGYVVRGVDDDHPATEIPPQYLVRVEGHAAPVEVSERDIDAA